MKEQGSMYQGKDWMSSSSTVNAELYEYVTMDKNSEPEVDC